MARLDLAFDGDSVPADIDCPPDLLAALASCGVACHAAEAPRDPAIIVDVADGRFRFSGPAYLAPFSVAGVDAALGSVMAGLAACRALAAADGVLCLHGAAAVIAGRGYLFLAPFGNGKSSLMAELAVRGAAIIADDVVQLNIRGATMTGLPVPPRLRQAFLKTASPRVKAWAAGRSVLAGPRYAYLSGDVLRPGPQPLTDIVLLSRGDGGRQAEPLLEAASPGVLIPRLLWHNMSRHHPASAIAAMAEALAGRLRGSILHAADIAAAAAGLVAGTLRSVPGSGHAPPASRRHDDGLHVLRTDRGAIISDDNTGRIFEINESAFVMLTLLQQGGDAQQVHGLLREIYPDAPQEALGQQLAACMRQFADCGLISPPPLPAAT